MRMQININVTKEELNEMGLNELELENHVIDALDSFEQEMAGFNVSVSVY